MGSAVAVGRRLRPLPPRDLRGRLDGVSSVGSGAGGEGGVSIVSSALALAGRGRLRGLAGLSAEGVCDWDGGSTAGTWSDTVSGGWRLVRPAPSRDRDGLPSTAGAGASTTGGSEGASAGATVLGGRRVDGPRRFNGLLSDACSSLASIAAAEIVSSGAAVSTFARAVRLGLEGTRAGAADDTIASAAGATSFAAALARCRGLAGGVVGVTGGAGDSTTWGASGAAIFRLRGEGAFAVLRPRVPLPPVGAPVLATSAGDSSLDIQLSPEVLSMRACREKLEAAQAAHSKSIRQLASGCPRLAGAALTIICGSQNR